MSRIFLSFRGSGPTEAPKPEEGIVSVKYTSDLPTMPSCIFLALPQNNRAPEDHSYYLTTSIL